MRRGRYPPGWAAYLVPMVLGLDGSQMNLFYRTGVWLKFLFVVVGVPFFVGFVCLGIWLICRVREEEKRTAQPLDTVSEGPRGE